LPDSILNHEEKVRLMKEKQTALHLWKLRGHARFPSLWLSDTQVNTVTSGNRPYVLITYHCLKCINQLKWQQKKQPH